MQKRTKRFKCNIYILSPLFFLILLSFNSTPPTTTNVNDKSAFPVIIDTLSEPASFLRTKSMITANYDILYLGYEKDSILLDHNNAPYEKNVRRHDVYSKYKQYNKAKIQLEIDCSQEIKEDINSIFERSINDTSHNKYYKAYPVIIKNQETNPIIIGHTGYSEQLPLILEAKDQAGEWRAIEEEFTYFCGFGIDPIVLNPQEIIVTGVKIHQGTFKTELRLKINRSNTYSRTFKGSVDPNQFSPIFNEETFFNGK
jgi:hypothetical protein